MITAWELYLWTRLDALQFLVNISWCFIFVWVIIAAIFGLCGEIDGDGSRNTKRMIGMFKSVFFKAIMVFVVVALFIPSKKDAAMIWIVPQLATVENAELLQGEAAEIYKLAKDALKESIGVEEKE